MKRVIALLATAAIFVACDKKPAEPEAETTKAAVEAETTAETTPEPEPAPEPELTDAEKEAREKAFGAFIEGADYIKVGQSHFKARTGDEDGPTKPGETKDPEVIATLIAAMDAETMSQDPASECRPTHYVVFFKEGQKLRSFKFWCEESEEVPGLYLEDRIFKAKDAKTAGKMLRGVLDGTYSE